MVGTTVNGVKITQSAYDKAVKECANMKFNTGSKTGDYHEHRYQVLKKAVVYSGGRVGGSRSKN